MFVVRCRGNMTRNWTTHFFSSLMEAFSYIKATKYTGYCKDDIIFLTRESLDNCCLWSGTNAPEIWHLKD